jgi:hypothetical protein
MTTANVVPLRQRLVEYSQGHITEAALWRALFTHKDWLVPVTELTIHYRPSTGGEYTLPGDSYVFDQEWSSHPRHLFLFTDPEPAFLAKSKGIPLGMFSSGIGGVEVFGNLNSIWEGVTVNPGSPSEETWFVPRGSFASLASLAGRFLLEEEFTRLATMDPSQANAPEEVSKLVKRLREFQEFEIPVWENTRIPLAVSDSRTRINKMVVCTWPDCIEAVKATLPPDQRAQVKKVLLDGTAMFQGVTSFGFPMVVINPCGPGSGLELKLSAEGGTAEIRNASPPG